MAVSSDQKTVVNSQKNANEISVAALPDGGYIVASSQSQNGFFRILVQRFNAAGVAVGTETIADPSASQNQISPKVVALEGGGFVVGYVATDYHSPQAFGIHAQIYDNAGLAVGSELTASNAGGNASIDIAATHDGGFVLGWNEFLPRSSSYAIDARLQAFSPTGSALGAPVDPTSSNDEFLRAVTVLGDGDIVVGTSVGLHRLDPGGLPVGVAIATDSKVLDMTARTDGGFAVLSTATLDGVTSALRVTHYSSSGSLVGSPIDLHVYPAETGRYAGSSIAADAAGGSVVSATWTTDDGPSPYEVSYINSSSTVVESAMGTVESFTNLGRRVASDLLLDGRIVSIATEFSPVGGSHTYAEIFDVHAPAPVGPDPHVGTGGPDVIVGGLASDHLQGLGGDDILDGGPAADIADGAPAADILDGGPGFDTVSYQSAAERVSIAYGNASGAAAGDYYISIEAFRLSEFGDLYIASDAADAPDATLDGGAGNDTLVTYAGDDILHGGADNDYIAAGDGHNELFGDGGDDRLYSGVDADVLHGGGGADLLSAGDGHNELFGDAGVDTLKSGAGDDILHGGADNDNLSAGDGQNQLFGDEGDDVLVGGLNDDIMHGGAGNDTLTAGGGHDQLFGDGGDDRLFGGPDDDLLDGGAGNDYFSLGAGHTQAFGGEGNDNFSSGLGIDLMDGGAGRDRVFYFTALSAVSVSLATAGPQNTGGGGVDTLASIEDIEGSIFSDVLTGDEADNRLNGIAGDDVLIGGGGKDVLDGGSGRDTADYSALTTAISVTIGTVDFLGQPLEFAAVDTGDGSPDIVLNVEIYKLGAGDDAFQSGLSSDTVFGAGGDDHLSGGGGADALFGGSGQDLIEGGAGADLLNGDGGADRLSGGDDADILNGGSNNDILTGNAGDDVLAGGSGNDKLDGGSGFDRADYSLATSGVTVDLDNHQRQDTLGAGADLLISIDAVTGSDFADKLLGSHMANRIEGGKGADLIRGMAGDDTLDGGLGDDKIDGGAGADLLTGGAGHDTFIFKGLNAPSDSTHDRILDLETGDRIDLSFIDADTGTSGDQAFTLVAALNGHAGQAALQWDSGAGQTNLLLDVDGDGLADSLIQINGQHSDFAGFVL